MSSIYGENSTYTILNTLGARINRENGTVIEAVQDVVNGLYEIRNHHKIISRDPGRGGYVN